MFTFIRVWAKACNAPTSKTPTQIAKFPHMTLFFLLRNSEHCRELVLEAV